MAAVVAVVETGIVAACDLLLDDEKTHDEVYPQDAKADAEDTCVPGFFVEYAAYDGSCEGAN